MKNEKRPVWFKQFTKKKNPRNLKFWRNFLVISIKNYIYKYKTRKTRAQLRAQINRPKCKCGYEFILPWAVLYRPLNCPKCRRSYFYERDLKMNYTFDRTGRYKTKGELERELEDYGRSR